MIASRSKLCASLSHKLCHCSCATSIRKESIDLWYAGLIASISRGSSLCNKHVDRIPPPLLDLWQHCNQPIYCHHRFLTLQDTKCSLNVLLSAFLTFWIINFALANWFLKWLHEPCQLGINSIDQQKNLPKFLSADFEVKIKVTKCPINEGSVQRTLSPNINVIERSWKVKNRWWQ